MIIFELTLKQKCVKQYKQSNIIMKFAWNVI